MGYMYGAVTPLDCVDVLQGNNSRIGNNRVTEIDPRRKYMRVAENISCSAIDEERPKKALGGMTPSAYAKKLANKAVILTTDSKLNATENGETSIQ